MRNLRVRIGLAVMFCLLCLSGCMGNIVPSQYDMKLKTKASSITAEVGGASGEVEVTVDSRRYQELSSDQSFFLSYHLLSADGTMLAFDNERSTLETIDARGVKKETLKYTAPMEAGSYILQVDLVEEGVTWFSEQGMPTLEIPLVVEKTYEPPCAETKLTVQPQTLDVSEGDEIQISVTVQNQGTMPIYASGERESLLSYHLEDAKGTEIAYDGERTELADDIAPGESQEIILSVNEEALEAAGSYVLKLDMVIEGVTWYGERGMELTRVPIEVRELKPLALRNPDGISALEDSYENLNMTWRLIQQTMENTRASLTIPVEDSEEQFAGMYAGNTYPEFWVRDHNTAQFASRFFNSREYLSQWIEMHLRYQGEDGNIRDWIRDGGESDKNTVETDQETSLVQAAWRYCTWSGDFAWLQKEINGQTVLKRLESALQYLLENKTDEESGLLVGAHTIDWGDVELGPEDQSAVYADENSIWTVDIYDQAMFVLAANELSELLEQSGNTEAAAYWSGQAEIFSEKARQLLWLPEKGYFWVCTHLTEYSHDFNEDDIFAMGGNAMAVLSGIADETMAASVFETAAQRQEEYGISTISGTVLPTYPEGSFSHPAVRSPYSYQNGGQWDWFGARLITAMYRLGYDEMADEKLIEIADKVVKNKEINEWEAPDGTPCGSSNFAGGAGSICQAITEGRYGISWTAKELSVKPSSGLTEGAISLTDSASGSTLMYEYTASDSGIWMNGKTDFDGEFKLFLPIPENAEVLEVRLNGTKADYQLYKERNADYVQISRNAPGEFRVSVTFAADAE